MKEVSDILKSYVEAKAEGKKTALATVVKVEGSSYRQPGARMLVTEDGLLTGAISGGCLEGDALRRALLAIHQQKNILITYDTSNEDDIDFGVQLGCNGIVHILFEYIDETLPNHPMHILQQLETERMEAVILTIFSLKRQTEQIGTVMIHVAGDNLLSYNDTTWRSLPELNEAISRKVTIIKNMPGEEQHQALINYIAPPVSLVIAGAGNDVKPLVKMAELLGWEVTVGDGRITHATIKRFPEAKKVLNVKPEQLIDQVVLDSHTYFVLMTHNYKYDLAMLKLLLACNCPYIGVLGPKTKLNRMLEDLENDGVEVTDEQLDRIYGPVGLDIGAETAEEIAVSVVAEIKGVMSGKHGTSLKYRTDKIHNATYVV